MQEAPSAGCMSQETIKDKKSGGVLTARFVRIRYFHCGCSMVTAYYALYAISDRMLRTLNFDRLADFTNP
jgi:hypothetical protein